MLKLIFCSDFICLKLFLCLEHFQGQLVYSDQIDFESGNSFPPKPNLMILTKTDSVNPSPLNAPVNWSNKHEICIGRFKLPEETLFGKESCEEKVQLFIQLNPYLRELKSFLADVHTEEFDKFKEKYIGPIVISLKTDLACSQEGKLLELTTAEERNAAFNLVMKKEISQLTTGKKPNKGHFYICSLNGKHYLNLLIIAYHNLIFFRDWTSQRYSTVSSLRSERSS